MKRKLLIVLLACLALLPGLIWWYDSHHHQLGLTDLQADKSLYQHRLQVTSAATPALFGETLFLISQTDPYLYEFDLSDQPELVVRYRVGPKQKHVLYQPDRIIMGFTVDGIRNYYGQIKVFQPSLRRLETVIEDVPFLSDATVNMMVYDGWIYTWGWQEDQVLVAWTDGTRSEQVLLAPPPDKAAVGFRYQPKLVNYPLLEIGQNAYRLSPAGPRLLEPTDPLSDGLVDEAGLGRLLARTEYDQLYLAPDYLLARHLINQEAEDRQPFVSDIFVLPGFQPAGQITSERVVYPADLAVSADLDFARRQADEAAQAKVVAFYERQLARTEQAMADYIAHRQTKAFVLSPTSLGLIGLQIGWLYICLRAIKESGLAHEN